MRLIAEGSESDYTHGGTQKDEYGPEDVLAVACPLCSGDDGERLHTEHGQIGICRCRRCGLIYTSPRLKSPETVYWGKLGLYLAEARLIFEGRAQHHRDPNNRAELRRIARYRRGGRLLDVGCNMGMLLRLALRDGWDAVGIEPSPALAALAARWGATVHNCFVHQLPDEERGAFDVVVLSDVLEHITAPRDFLGLPTPAQRIMGDVTPKLVTISREACEKAREPKELHVFEGATHIDMYDRPQFVTPAVGKLAEFFGRHLAEGTSAGTAR